MYYAFFLNVHYQIIAERNCRGGRIGTVASTLADASLPTPIDAADGAAWAAAFAEFFTERKTNADAIADLALENFEEVSCILSVHTLSAECAKLISILQCAD